MPYRGARRLVPVGNLMMHGYSQAEYYSQRRYASRDRWGRRQSVKELLSVIRNRNIGLLLGGQFVSAMGDWFYQIALSIAVYNLSGGKSFYVGLLWIMRLVPALLFGPISGTLADRMGHRRAMITADLTRMVIVAVLAVTLTGRTWAVLFPLAFCNSVMSGLFRPASVGFIPTLVRSKDERLSANASMMQIESIAGIVGSALGGIIAGAGHVTGALVLDAGTFAISAGTLWLIRVQPVAADAQDEEGGEDAEEIGSGFMAGLRFLIHRPVLIFVATVMLLPEFASGSFIVWIVPYADKSLHLGEAGVGYLYAVMTAGALAGGVLAAVLGSNIKLDRLLAISVGVSGAALAIFGVANVAAIALVFACLYGLAETVEYAAYETLLQQAVPENAIGRATGTMDSLFFAVMLIGTAVSGILASTVGLTIAITGLGTLVVVATGLAWLNLRIRTAGQPDAAFLAKIPPFAEVPVEIREWAVRRMVRERVPAGTVIIRQGDEGDLFYTIASGRVEIGITENGRSMNRELGAGDFFGEIALLQNVPRTATVTAAERVTLWTMSRQDFLELQNRASEFKESLWEAATARLQESTDFKMALAARP
jgi:MFS family permease